MKKVIKITSLEEDFKELGIVLNEFFEIDEKNKTIVLPYPAEYDGGDKVVKLGYTWKKGGDKYAIKVVDATPGKEKVMDVKTGKVYSVKWEE